MAFVVWRIVGIVFLLMSIIGFSLMGIDKSCARGNRRRIPEKTLFLCAAALGSLGIFIGMHVFRHKTKHASFFIGIPLILLIQIGLALLALYVFSYN